MDVDNADSWSNNPPDSGKFVNLKSFVAAAREFEATHSETAVNLMTRYLGLISSSCDLSVFSPGRSEVCAFFSSLWRVMCDGRGPHWAGVAVLARACLEPSAKHALTHTYKFLPILSRLLSDSISNEKKIKLLCIMQDISYGIKISWQESYLPGLMKQLTEWITQPIGDPQQKTIGHISLTVLVNICYGNLPAIYALMRTVDTKDFVVHLINLKDGGYGGVVVCRLLLCLTGATRGAAATRQADVHSYLCCTMKTFKKAIVERDGMQLLHSCTFMNDLIADDNFKSFVLTYPHFDSIADNLKDVEALCKAAGDDSDESELSSSCLRHALKFLTLVIGLDLYSLRVHHCEMVRLCIKSSAVCLPESLQFFAAIVTQYRDEGRLPKELIAVIGEGLPGMLVAPSLEPGTAGLQWLQVVGALCESCETQDHVLRDVTPDAFEDTLYSVLEHATQNGEMGNESGQVAASVGCRVALTLAPLNRQWEAALNRLLAHHQVRKLLCAGVTSSNGTRRKNVLQLIKHHYFPSEQLTQVFGADIQTITGTAGSAGSASGEGSVGAIGTGCICDAQQQFVTPAHERAIDALLAHLTQQLNENKISNVATSSVMELYGYKINNLEQRLHSHTVALQGASEQMASLQHALAMLQATNSSQQDVLYATQMQNEKHRKMIDDMHRQLEEAEKAVRGFRVKVAAEKLDKERQKETLQNEFKSQILNIENEMKCRERAAEERVRKAEEETNALHKKLEQLNAKNNELAGVLIKFEERVKQRDKRLEESAATEAALKREIDSKEHNIKELKKTVVERETRLYQVVAQLEEMKRVQEMVAKLMSKSAATAT